MGVDGSVRDGTPVIVIRGYEPGLSGVRATNPRIELSVGPEPALANEPVLRIAYPEPADDPAGRDVWCDAENRDWTRGRALAFQVRPASAVRLSVSFFDRNRVVYTTWIDLQGGVWQPAHIAFEEMRPNPYFQPPDARTGAPLDVSEVQGIAFAPHDATSGHLALSQFVVVA